MDGKDVAQLLNSPGTSQGCCDLRACCLQTTRTHVLRRAERSIHFKHLQVRSHWINTYLQKCTDAVMVLLVAKQLQWCERGDKVKEKTETEKKAVKGTLS